MPFILPAIMGAASLAGNIYGMSKSAKLQKERQAMIDKQKDTFTGIFNKSYYQDPLQEDSTQAMLTMLQEKMQENLKGINTNAARLGSTTEAVTAQKAAGQKSYGNVIKNLIVSNNQRKQNELNNYWNRIMTLNNQSGNLLSEQQGSISNATTDALSMAMMMSSMYGGGQNRTGTPNFLPSKGAGFIPETTLPDKLPYRN